MKCLGFRLTEINILILSELEGGWTSLVLIDVITSWNLTNEQLLLFVPILCYSKKFVCDMTTR